MAFFKKFFKKNSKESEIDKKKYQSTFYQSSSLIKKFFQKLISLNKKIDENFFLELKNILLKIDFSYELAEIIVEQLKKEAKLLNISDPKEINNLLINILKNSYFENNQLSLSENKIKIFLIVGINGVGKTLTCAKIANLFKDKIKVLLVAGDTFRKGAVAQLEFFAKKLNIDLIKPKKEYQDPASLMYEAINFAKKNLQETLIIFDSGGRIESSVNLLNQLKKIASISEKLIGNKCDEIIMVIDSLTGQNSINQIKYFQEKIQLSGIIFTKVDSLSKFGIIFKINHLFKLPILFLGNGEKVEDLLVFDLKNYLQTNFIFYQ